MKKLIFIVALSIAAIGCEVGVNPGEIVVGVKASRFYCNSCGYEWNGSTLTTVVCPHCESMRIEIIGEAEF